MRTLKIYSFSDFQIHTTKLLTLVVILYIASPWIIYVIIESPIFWLPSFISPTCHHHLPPEIINRFFVGFLSLFCFVLDFTFKWDHAVFVFLCLISHSIMPSRSISKTSLLSLNNIPQCVCTYTYVFLICSPIHEHSGCFHVLTIVNKAQWTMGCISLVEFMFLFSLNK